MFSNPVLACVQNDTEVSRADIDSVFEWCDGTVARIDISDFLFAVEASVSKGGGSMDRMLPVMRYQAHRMCRS